jgi:biotin-[acetyl-CoA-carboxylase] ligase BirA-like protein
MEVYTDNPGFAAIFLPSGVADSLVPFDGTQSTLRSLANEVYPNDNRVLTASVPDYPWPHLFLSEFSEGSQYDLFIDWLREGRRLPHGLVAMAGGGSGFHGFKGRNWAAEAGNIHVVIHLAPNQPIERFEVAFTVLATLSAVDSLNQIGRFGGTAQIKWVNDILLDGAKAGGVLAFTQTQGQTVSSAVLGIGLNVEAAPDIEPTPFVPRVTSLRECVGPEEPDMRGRVLRGLLQALAKNYRVLLEEGADPLVQRYREHAGIIGETVSVYSDHTTEEPKLLAKGTVSELGDNLELYLDRNHDPITTGRLVLGKGWDEQDECARGAGELGLASHGAKRNGT